jgi:hypothetical protein
VGNDEAIALLREIRDILIAQRELQKNHEGKYQQYLDDSRKDHAEQIRKSVWSHRKEQLIFFLTLFVVLSMGVFVGVLVGVRMSRPWQ